MKKKITTFIESLNHAIDGILFAANNERNFRIHILAMVVVLFLSVYFSISKLEMIAVFFAITFVLIAELVNSVVENTIDLIIQGYNKKAKVAKDMAAGAVLISAVNAIIVGFLVFFDKFSIVADEFMLKIAKMPVHIATIGLLIIMCLVIYGKAKFSSHGTSLQGGMPSGHTAIAFGISIAIWMISKDIRIFLLSILVAVLVGESRIETKVHNFWEVLAGALLGSITMFILFKLLGY